jgi:hypothetical protein
VSNLIVAVSPRFDPVNYGVKSVDIAIRPSSVWNTPPYYTIDSSKSNTTVYVHDSNVDVWTPHIAFFPSPPVQANGVVQGYGEFHREDYSPTNVCGSGAGGSDVGFGPFGGSFILVTRATLGTDFTFQSDSCSISSRPSYVFRNDADPYDTNKLEKLNFYLIQTTFCIGPHYNYGVCHNLPYLANAPFTLTVLPSGTTPAYKKVRLFMENPMPGLLIEAGPVPSLMQLGNGDVGNFTFFDIVN